MTRADATGATIRAAALAEFAAFGYRRTSIESIARRAGVSRATVYTYWAGKDELFRTLVRDLHEQHLSAMQAVATDPELDIETRLVRLLQARFAQFIELTSTSMNAAELYDLHSRLCGDIARNAQRRAEKIITSALRRAITTGDLDPAPSGLTVTQLAEVLHDSAVGAKGEDPANTTPADFANRLARSLRVVMAGLSPARASG